MTPDEKENPANKEPRQQQRSLAPSPSRWRNQLSSAFSLESFWIVAMKFLAPSLIEASNIKQHWTEPPVPDLQLLEALGCTCRVLDGVSRTPPHVGLSTQAAKSTGGFCILCVLLTLLVFGTSRESFQVPNSYHTFGRLLLQLSNYWSSWVISLSFIISYHMAICSPSTLTRLLTAASFFFPFYHSDHPLRCNYIYKG